AKLGQGIPHQCLVSHYQDHHALERQFFPGQSVDLFLGDAVDDLALCVDIVRCQVILAYPAEEAGLLPWSLVGSSVTLTYRRPHECQLLEGDALITERGDLIDELPYRIGRAVSPDAGGSRERAGVLGTVEEAASSIGVALVFAQVQVDAAVEGATQHIIHQRTAEVLAGGIPWHLSNVANADLRLRSPGLVDQIQRIALIHR